MTLLADSCGEGTRDRPLLKRHAIQVLHTAGQTLDLTAEGRRSVQHVVGKPMVTACP